MSGGEAPRVEIVALGTAGPRGRWHRPPTSGLAAPASPAEHRRAGGTGTFQPKIGASFGRLEATVARPDRVGQCALVLANGSVRGAPHRSTPGSGGGSRASQSPAFTALTSAAASCPHTTVRSVRRPLHAQYARPPRTTAAGARPPRTTAARARPPPDQQRPTPATPARECHHSTRSPTGDLDRARLRRPTRRLKVRQES